MNTYDLARAAIEGYVQCRKTLIAEMGNWNPNHTHYAGKLKDIRQDIEAIDAKVFAILALYRNGGTK